MVTGREPEPQTKGAWTLGSMWREVDQRGGRHQRWLRAGRRLYKFHFPEATDLVWPAELIFTPIHGYTLLQEISLKPSLLSSLIANIWDLSLYWESQLQGHRAFPLEKHLPNFQEYRKQELWVKVSYFHAICEGQRRDLFKMSCGMQFLIKLVKIFPWYKYP